MSELAAAIRQNGAQVEHFIATPRATSSTLHVVRSGNRSGATGHRFQMTA